MKQSARVSYEMERCDKESVDIMIINYYSIIKINLITYLYKKKLPDCKLQSGSWYYRILIFY